MIPQLQTNAYQNLEAKNYMLKKNPKKKDATQGTQGK